MYCDRDNVTDEPDYAFSFTPEMTGKYVLKLTNTSTGAHAIKTIEVKENSPFTVERIGATRINPFKSDYRMKVKIHAYEDFSGEVREYIPDNFSLISHKESQGLLFQKIIRNNSKLEISWEAQFKKNQEYIIEYIYRAPKISPELFPL